MNSSILAAIAGALTGGGEAWQIKQQQDRQKRLDDARIAQEQAQAAHQQQEFERQQVADQERRLNNEQTDVTGMLGRLGPNATLTPQQAVRTGNAKLDDRVNVTPDDDLSHSLFIGAPFGLPNVPAPQFSVAPTAQERAAQQASDAEQKRLATTRAGITDPYEQKLYDADPTHYKPTIQSFMDAQAKRAAAQTANQQAIDNDIARKKAEGPVDTEQAVARENALFRPKLRLHEGEKAIDQKYAQTADVDSIAQAIVRGEQPPDMKGLYRNTAGVRAALAKNGYNLTQATEDWNATSKYLSTLNGQQQVRLRQAVDFTDDSLGKVEELAREWKSGGYGPLSRAALTAAAQGVGTPEQQSLATRFQSQIADVTSELGTVYKGGNSSTDESLKLAAKNLQADWSEKALLDNVAQIRTNLGYRRNSMKAAGVSGASAANPYTPGAAGRAPAGAVAPPTAGAPKVMRFDAQGNLIP